MAVARFELLPSEARWLATIVNDLPREVRDRHKQAIREVNRQAVRATEAEAGECRQREREAAMHPQAPQ